MNLVSIDHYRIFKAPTPLAPTLRPAIDLIPTPASGLVGGRVRTVEQERVQRDGLDICPAVSVENRAAHGMVQPNFAINSFIRSPSHGSSVFEQHTSYENENGTEFAKEDEMT